jgi:2-polyprenyl-6-methoxyphenol hydroxylase-like FAD-dependent oxidoreductase
VRSRPNITLRFGWEVGKFSEDAEGVTVEARRASDGAAEAWRAKYLAGCDGGRSFVRRSVGIKYEGYEQLREAFYSGRMISTHLTAPTLYRDFLGTRRGFQYWVLNRETRSTIVALDGKEQFLLFTKPSESNPNPDDAELARIVRCCAGADLPVKIIGHRPWTAGVALVAERFAAGRVLLAGDAVHVFTPNGGFGMNTGIDDAANLAWKLAAVAQGWGGARLLESYEAERKPVAHRNTKAARDFGKNIADVRVAPEIEDDTTTGERARKEAGEVLATFGEEFASIGVQLGARYDGSPIVVADGTPPPFRFSEYVPTSVPGGRAPHIWMREGRGEGDSLFDHLGIGFTLLRLGKSAPEAAEIQLAALERSVPLKVLHLADAEARELYGCDLALVRPDQHVAWRGNRVPADSGRMIRQVIGDPI